MAMNGDGDGDEGAAGFEDDGERESASVRRQWWQWQKARGEVRQEKKI